MYPKFNEDQSLYIKILNYYFKSQESSALIHYIHNFRYNLTFHSNQIKGGNYKLQGEICLKLKNSAWAYLIKWNEGRQ